MKLKEYSTSILFLGISALYIIFLCPTLFSGDSPMLATSAFALGLAHPPGYPLYVMMGNAMTFIPFGSVALKLNLLSAFSGATASVLVFKSVRTLTGDYPAAVFSALLCALVPLAWTESTKAEVYTLNAALATAVFYLGLRFLKEVPDKRLLLLMSFLLGLGMGNHHTIGFMALPLALAVILRARNWRTVLYCALFFSLGMSVYALGYVRSVKYLADKSLFTYSDTSTLDTFLITFFRKEYRSVTTDVVTAPIGDITSFLRGVYNATRYLTYGNMGFFSLFAILSVFLARKQKTEFSFIYTAFISYAFILSAMVYAFRTYNADDLYFLDPYLLPLLYITAVLAGCGIFFLRDLINIRFPVANRPIALAIVLLPLVLFLPDTLKEKNFSNHYLIDDYADNALESLPPEAILVAVSDSSTFPLNYKSFVERKREDVLVLFGDKEVTTLHAAPLWRLSVLFPDIPFGGPFSPVATNYLKNRNLYAFEPAFLSDEINSIYVAAPHIHSYRLFLREDRVNGTQAQEGFKRAFDTFVYERSLDERSSDRFSTELKMSMFIPVSHYAWLMKKQGAIKISWSYYEDSLKLITSNGVAHYMTYLNTSGRKEETEAFIEAIEPYAQKYPEVRKLSNQIKKQFL